MTIQATHRERAYELLEGSAGTMHTLTAGRFRRGVGGALERMPLAGLERTVEVRFGASRPVAPGGRHNPRDGRGVREQVLTVRVGYVLGHAGDGVGPEPPETVGDTMNGATVDAVEDRAETDAHDIRACLGEQANWSGLTPDVIDCAPVDEDGDLQVLTGRAVREVRFRFLTWASIPGTYAPTV